MIAIIISLFIEGICQVGIEKCFRLLSDKKLFKKNYPINNLKDFLTVVFGNSKYFILFYIFIRPTVFWESILYANKANCKKNPMKFFINILKKRYKSEKKRKSWKFYNKNSTYSAINICAKVIEKEGKMHDIYRYRDNSYVMQMLRNYR